MNLHRTLCVLGMLLLALTGKAAEPLRTEGNVPIEIAFTAQRPHADPFHEVTLDVQVTAPDGTAKNVPAFWAGGGCLESPLRVAANGPASLAHRVQ